MAGMARPSSYSSAQVEIELSDDLFSRFAVDVDKVAEQPPNHNLISERGSGRDDPAVEVTKNKKRSGGVFWLTLLRLIYACPTTTLTHKLLPSFTALKILALDFHQTEPLLVCATSDGAIRYSHTITRSIIDTFYVTKHFATAIKFTHHHQCVIYASNRESEVESDVENHSIRYLSLKENTFLRFFKVRSKAVMPAYPLLGVCFPLHSLLLLLPLPAPTLLLRTKTYFFLLP